MPDGEGTTSQEGFGRASPMMIQQKNFPPEQYPSSASTILPQRAPPAFFFSQQTPHRVQSSTNLDLVDCVGSDLLLAMNSLDVSEQARVAAGGGATHINGHHLLGGNGSHNGGGEEAQPADSFLPLAALAPPPTRQPAWITAQQQQARVQNEHFPSRLYGTRSNSGGGNGGGSGGSSGEPHRVDDRSRGGSDLSVGARAIGEDHANGVRGGAEYEYSQQGNGSSSGGGGASVGRRGSPGTAPPPGFGIGAGVAGGGGGGAASMDQGLTSQGSWNGSSGARRPLSAAGTGTTPHLDESWTAVLNAPAGAELMEFLTERASRALVLWNVETIGEDELRAACEAHGPLYYLRAEHRRKRVVFLAYYDVRDAVNAHHSLGPELALQIMDEHGSRPPPAVHFSVELHAGFSYKEGSVVVHNLPAQTAEAEVAHVFQIYGDLQGVTRHSGTHQTTPASFSVEFCSIQDARIAAQELTVRNPWGHGITVEPAVRSEGERSLGRQLHATLNRWTAEATQAAAVQHAGMFSVDDRGRSTSSSVFLSGRSSSGSDSPSPKAEEHGRDLGYMMDSYTPMTSANTTPATTPGSTPPSGADAYHYMAGSAGGKSPKLHQQYMGMPMQQQYGEATGGGASSCSSSSRSMHAQQQQHQQQPHLRTSSAPGSAAPPGCCSSSAGAHPMYASASSSVCNGAPHRSFAGSAGHHHPHHPASRSMHMHGGDMPPAPVLGCGSGSGSVGGSKTHSHGSPLGGPTQYSSSPGANAYFVDLSPGFSGDHDDTCTPPAPMWASSLSLSPPSARAGAGGGMRGSPPLRGMPGGVAGSGLGYKERVRQTSLDEGRLGAGASICPGARSMRCSSDGAQVLASPGPDCGGSGGHEFSLDLKKVSKGLDKRTTIMIRNIPNKYTQTMLLQEIDSSYRGAYDFFYLPIDFKNKCNVGYAFINFMDYRRIVPFFREFNAQRWKNFNSEKVCAISYARIQGKASMISRFQNSSLMEKDGEYRPLIFHSSGTERGRPEPFPASSKVFRGVVPGAGGMTAGVGFGGGGRDRERSMSASSSLA